MTAFAVTITALAIATAVAVAAVTRFREAWGRSFDRELCQLASGGSWIEADSTSEALSLDLIRRYDRLMAGARA